MVSPLRDARSQATGLLRALLAELDLTAVPVVTGSTAIEIRIGLGKAAPNIAASLAAVLAGIVTRTLGREDVQIRPLELVTAVFSPVADGPEGRFGAAMPVAWDDLLPVLLDDAASRVASAKALVAPLAAAKLDEARLIRALERLALRHR